ncbi:MAG: hypothetical protein KAT68_12885 [Bacteroidales bacterium]|nr:hypothetical protein [Bacteroidales bacterium]
MNKFITTIIFLTILLTVFSCRKSDYTTISGDYIVITDDGNGIGTTTWSKDKKYLLDGFVFVNDGQTLIIEPGTVIRAKTGQGSNATALIIARGAKIIAEGTRENPIIFTVEGDDLEGSVPVMSKGLCGGIIILGNAKLNTDANEAMIEGIPYTEPRGVYGGNDDEDDSGILRYVSIRHGGTNIGEGNEINGLTLGGVGSSTIIDYVEIISNKDDGIEFFGGTVNCKHIIVAFCGDDCFDFDNGYRGYGQFWLAIQDVAEGDLISEHDGGSDPITGTPYSIPVIYNSTFIGRGNDILNNLMIFKENAAGKYANSIFINQGKGIEIEYKENRKNSYDQFEDGNLEFRNNIFYQIGNDSINEIFKVFGDDGVDVSQQNTIFRNYALSANNLITDPGIEITDNTYLIIPSNNSLGNLCEYPDPWFVQVDYKGAFGNYNWANGWSLLSQSGFIE